MSVVQKPRPDTTSRRLQRRAERVLPGGVNSPVRAFHAVGGRPLYATSARGAHVVDSDGRKLVDYVGSWGVHVAGHAHPRIVEAIRSAAASSSAFGITCEAEIELAEEVRRRVPSIETVRFVNSGTEAVMSALRLARGATGRARTIKFDGGYHGHHDALLVRSGSGPMTLGAPDSAGVPTQVAATTLVAPFNDAEAVAALFERYPGEIAAVVVEPVAGNMGVVPPRAGFLEALRDLCTGHGALLVFDEVMTGFRVARGGAQELYGVTPDLTCLGKILGGGLPIGAFGGPSELLRELAPVGPVYQAGTLSGNPLAMRAGLASLSLLDDDAYRRLEVLGARHQSVLEDALGGLPATVQRVGSMLSVFFTGRAVRDLADVRASDSAVFRELFGHLLDDGILLPPSPFEAWFVSLEHGDDELCRLARALASFVRQSPEDRPTR